jgi:hypothetical protein
MNGFTLPVEGAAAADVWRSNADSINATGTASTVFD